MAIGDPSPQHNPYRLSIKISVQPGKHVRFRSQEGLDCYTFLIARWSDL